MNSKMVAKAMDQFLTSTDAPAIVSSFQFVLSLCELESMYGKGRKCYTTLKSFILPMLPYKTKRIFSILDAKLAPYGSECEGKNIGVAGGGPCGLRTAIEVLLLGASVVVMEQRESFNRENILHLWEWVVHDLNSLGAKLLIPHFCSSGTDHVGTKQLQCLLLKVALVLGVTYNRNVKCTQVVWDPSLNGWTMCCQSSAEAFQQQQTQQQPRDGDDHKPPRIFSMVVDASGKASPLSRGHFQSVGVALKTTRPNTIYSWCSGVIQLSGFVFCTLSDSQATGLVAHFENGRTKDERGLVEFSWSRQFNQVTAIARV
jgi:hypothetical protein